MRKPVTIVYLPDEYEKVTGGSALIPHDCFDGPIEPSQVIVYRFDPDTRIGFGTVYNGLVCSVSPLGDGRAYVSIDWGSARLEPDWPIERYHSGWSNHLTLGWRWQWHPARTLNWSWFRRPPAHRGTDEFCNKSVEIRVPFGAVTVFWKRPYRTKYDGRCEKCLSE